MNQACIMIQNLISIYKDKKYTKVLFYNNKIKKIIFFKNCKNNKKILFLNLPMVLIEILIKSYIKQKHKKNQTTKMKKKIL